MKLGVWLSSEDLDVQRKEDVGPGSLLTTRGALQKVRGGTLLIVLGVFTCEFLGRRHGF